MHRSGLTDASDVSTAPITSIRISPTEEKQLSENVATLLPPFHPLLVVSTWPPPPVAEFRTETYFVAVRVPHRRGYFVHFMSYFENRRKHKVITILLASAVSPQPT